MTDPNKIGIFRFEPPRLDRQSFRAARGHRTIPLGGFLIGYPQQDADANSALRLSERNRNAKGKRQGNEDAPHEFLFLISD